MKPRSMADVTLDFLGEQLKRVLDELAGLRDDVRSMRDQLFVQGGILLRLEHRDRTADGETLALQQQVQRLQRRVEALEEKVSG
jgi:hypothetical protein